VVVLIFDYLYFTCCLVHEKTWELNEKEFILNDFFFFFFFFDMVLRNQGFSLKSCEIINGNENT
jgi:hypothetical protein